MWILPELRRKLPQGHSTHTLHLPRGRTGDGASDQGYIYDIEIIDNQRIGFGDMKLRADFNGLFREVLCLSHEETCKDENGNDVQLHEGMEVIAFDEDLDANNNRDDLVAKGIVERPPEWLKCRGSKWVLRIDKDGVRNESEIKQ